MEQRQVETLGRITRTQAVMMARRAHATQTKKPVELAKILREAGYVSPQTGKPVGPQGAYAMALSGKARVHRKKRTKGPSPKQTTNTDTQDRDALLSLILQSNLKPEAKIKAALGCLHGKGV